MRLGIPLLQSELNSLSSWVAGFYYVRNCLHALASLNPVEVPEVTVFVPKSFDDEVIYPEYTHQTPWLSVIRVPEELLNEQAYGERLQEFVDKHPVDIIFPMLVVPIVALKGRAIGWIPDYQHKHYPEFFDEQEISLREQLFDFLISYCDRIACSSAAVIGDLQRFYPVAQNKGALLRFVSLLPERIYAQTPLATLERLGIREKYIYLPNQFWIHKNHRCVFEAWKLLKDAGREYMLVCTGWSEDFRAPGYYQQLLDYITEHRLQHTIKLLGFIDRDDQVQLYRGAAAVLQPSLFEGWSTSIEDAKTLGKPMIVSNIAVHHEQAGEDALYFDKGSAAHLATFVEAAWDQLSLGYNPTAEMIARRDTTIRAQAFGRALVSLFEQVGAGAIDDGAWNPQRMLPQIAGINRSLAAARAECAARLTVIEQLDAQARELREQLAASEADRAARLTVIERLDAEVTKLREQLAASGEQLKLSEADRLARLEEIQMLQQQLDASESDRVARMHVIRAQQQLLDRPLINVLRRMHFV